MAHHRLRLGLLGLAAAAALAAGLAAAHPAQAALTAVGPVNPATRYPDWFQDSTGNKLQLCLDGPPYCLAAAADLTPPDGEAFWFQAEAVVPVGASGEARLVLAQEAAFLDAAPIAFSRVRIGVGGAAANTTYTFNHPYGTATVTTDALGNGRFSSDVGCEAGPCNWAAALPGGVGPQFLRWDPTVAPAPPAGHIGDAATPHAVVGGSVRNSFGVAGGASTNLFTVQGKLAGPPVAVFAAPELSNFGDAAPGQPVTRTITVTSFGVPDDAGRSALAMGVAGVTGPQAAEFAMVGNTCTGQTLPSSATCTVTVQFTPAAAGARTANLDFSHNAAGAASRVILTGTGAAPATTLVAGSRAAGRLRVSKLRTTHRMSRARVLRRGLRLSMRLPQQTGVLKIAVYRFRGRTLVRKPVWLGYRVVGRLSRGGLYRVRLDSRTLRRRMKAGRYQLNVTPGLGQRDLGVTTTTPIRITRR